MNLLDFNDDVLIYILSFSINKFNLLLTCKRIYNLSYGRLKRNRRGWLSYNITQNYYRKALHYSIRLNKINLLYKLLYDITKFTNIKLERLHHDTINLCILYDQLNLLKILVSEYHVDPSYPRSIYFLKACKLGKIEIVKYLVTDKRIDINSQDVLCCSSLVLAAEHGHLQVVKFLTQQTDLRLYDAIEYSVFIANLNKHFEIVDYLSGFISCSP